MRSQGFTLLELLVSLAAGALLIAALSQVLITVRDGWRLAVESERTRQEELMAAQLLSRLLETCLPPEPNGGAHFVGGADRLEFTTIPAQAAWSLGRMTASLTPEPRPDGSLALVLRLTPHPPGTDTPRRRQWVLIEGLETIEISYLGDDLGQAQTRWHEGDRLPELIQLQALFRDKTRPPLSVAARPRQILSGACVIEWTSRTCRTY